MKVIRVLVVDDSAFMRRVISDIINAQSDMRVVGTARNGKDAIEKIPQLKPDVVTLDIEMPVMDGISTLRRIMEWKLPVIMLSSLTQVGAEMTVKALQLGAVDFVPKPSGTISLDMANIGDDIVDKIRIAALARPQLKRAVVDQPSRRVGWGKETLRPVPGRSTDLTKLVLIGASTGGPRALQKVLSSLPGDLDAGVLIVQHMPAGFTRSLAERLNSFSALRVKEAEHGEPICDGTAYIAPGGCHLQVMRSQEQLLVNLSNDVFDTRHCPSVDVMLESVAREFWGTMVVVILTGMGKDGSQGLTKIREKGARVIAEDASTCVVFGMPRTAIETGCVNKIAALPDIAVEIEKMLKVGR